MFVAKYLSCFQWNQAELSSFGSPKHRRFDDHRAMSHPDGQRSDSQGYQGFHGEPSSDYSHQEPDYSQGASSRGGFSSGDSREGRSAGGAIEMEHGVGSTLRRLMDMASDNSGGSSSANSNNSSAGSHLQSGESSADHSGNQQQHSQYGGGRGRGGMHSQGFRGRGSGAGGVGKARGGGGSSAPRSQGVGYDNSPQFGQNSGGFDVGWGRAQEGFGQHGGRPGGFNQRGGQVGVNQHGGQGGVNQHGRKGGFNQHGGQGGVNQHGREGGFSQHGGQGGVNQHGGQGGANQHGRQGGVNQHGGQGGVNQHGRQGGFNQHGGQGGANQHGRQGGVNQHGGQGGVNQHGRQGGVNQRGGQGGVNQHGRQGGISQHSGEGSVNQHGRQGGASAPRGRGRGGSEHRGGSGREGSRSGQDGDQSLGRGEDSSRQSGGTPGLGGIVCTRPDGSTYRRQEESLLQYSSKFQENKLPMEECFVNLCEMAKPLLYDMPRLDMASTKLEEFLLNDNVCLTPAYIYKGERVEASVPFFFTCNVYINDIFITCGVASNKKEAKNKGCDAAIRIFGTKTAQEIIATHEKVNVMQLRKDADLFECPLTYEESNIGILLGAWETNEKKTVADFIIKEPEEMNTTEGQNTTAILRQSADFSKVLLKFEFNASQEGFLCTVKMEGETLATASASERIKAKNLASHVALERLRQTHWTITVLKRDKPTPAYQPLTATLGRIRRKNPNSCERFTRNLREYLETYFAGLDDLTKWLPLSEELNSDECDAVYNVAKEISLKVESKRVDGAQGKKNFLVVSKKFPSDELFDYIWEKGGETWRYKLKAPAEIAPEIT